MNKYTVSLCITTYNRTDLLYESFRRVIDHPLISEILIVDDCSDMQITAQIWNRFQSHAKIRVRRNETNLGCYHNKKHAISQASNDWVILLDSDNIIDNDYVNRIETLMTAGVNPTTIYQPDWGRPHFNWTAYSGLIVNKGNVSRYAHEASFTTALNAMNYFVNKGEYLRVWEDRPEPWTADSLLQNTRWIEGGNSIYFVPDLSYEHRIHEGSHYREHQHKTGNLYNELVQRLKQLT